MDTEQPRTPSPQGPHTGLAAPEGDPVRRKKHWLATPKPFIAWGIFMGLATGGAFAVAGVAALREGVVWAGATCMVAAILFPTAFTLHSWRSERD